MDICIERDDFIHEDACFWTAQLSNGLLVFQDDWRPGLQESSAWLRLKRYCEENDQHILFIDFHFRSHHERVAEGADAYYFARGVKAWFSGPCQDTFSLGQLYSNHFSVARWIMPEILLDEVNDRNYLHLPLIAGKSSWRTS